MRLRPSILGATQIDGESLNDVTDLCDGLRAVHVTAPWEAHAKIFRRRGAPYPITNPHAVTFANESQVDASSCHFVHFAAKYGCRAANETREVPPSQLLRGPNGQPYTASCVAYEAIAESALVAAVERSVWEETRTR